MRCRARVGWVASAVAGLCAAGCSSSSKLTSRPDSGGTDGVVVDAPREMAPEAVADLPLDLPAESTDAPLDLSADRTDVADAGIDQAGDAGGDGAAPDAREGDGGCTGGPLTACTCGATCTGSCTPLCNAVSAGVCRDPANGTCDCGGVMVDNCVKPGTRCICPSCGDAPGALCVTDAQRAALCSGPSAGAFRCN